MPSCKDPFVYVKPTSEQVGRIQEIRDACHYLHVLIQAAIQPSRERSLAITKLEEVSMWCNKAIVFESAERKEDV